MNSFQIDSQLAESAERVWAEVTTFRGINAELAPWFRMTCPARLRSVSLTDIPLGERLCRSWMLLLGFLPVDYDDITLIQREPLAFIESSVMATQRSWRHERRIKPLYDGCIVTDHLSWEPRFPGAGHIFHLIVPALFRHRHQRLRRRFGTGSPPLSERHTENLDMQGEV